MIEQKWFEDEIKSKTAYLLYWAIIFVVSISMFIYGIAKPLQFGEINGLTPLSELTGQQLMWAFYGYSKAYPVIIGIFEITGAISLLFNRTRIFGCLLLSTILFNIILQDYIYEISALYTAIYYQILVLVIMAFDFDKIKQAVNHLFQSTKTKKSILLILAAFILAVAFKYIEAILF